MTKATVDVAWRSRVPSQRLVVRDAECRGLALVVNPSAMSWASSYKPRGLDSLTGKRFPSKSVTIGGPASHSPEAARAEANPCRDRVKAGADAVLNHRQAATRSGMMGVYKRAERMPERKAAMEAWASLLGAVIERHPMAKGAVDISEACAPGGAMKCRARDSFPDV
jgi:hypothetical protein